MPSKPHRMEEICERLVGKVPIINADLITGFPGHTIDTIVHDHEFFINHPSLNPDKHRQQTSSNPLLNPDTKPVPFANNVIETLRVNPVAITLPSSQQICDSYGALRYRYSRSRHHQRIVKTLMYISF